jgi:hypothetical protein
MRKVFNQKIEQIIVSSIVIFLIISCSPQIMLTSSWTNRQAKVKSAPLIMVMVLGQANSTTRQEVENKMVALLKKDGFKSVPATTMFQPGTSKRDSAELVNILRKNSIDMLLTCAVISKTENERFIPGAIHGTDIVVPASGIVAPNDYAYNSIYFGYNNYYNYSNSYQVIEAPKTPGVTVTDVHIVIQSNLYEVATPELIWHGLSTSYTKQPTTSEINKFSKAIIDDIRKNNLLIK